MRSQRGFSLVELLAALVVLTLVVTTTLAVFVERKHRQQQASEMILAYQVLANEAEVERRLDFDDVLPSTTFDPRWAALLAPLSPYTTKIEVSSPRGGQKDVTMSISWRKGERVAKLVLTRVDTGGGNLW